MLPSVMVTIAEADFVTSACDMAETVTETGFGSTDGAVYSPLGSTVPEAGLPPVTPFTCQETWVLLDPLTVALNCFCWFKRTLAAVGLMLTETVPPPPPPPPLPAIPPPQDGKVISDRITVVRISWEARGARGVGRRTNPPITIPNVATHSKRGALIFRSAIG